MADFAALFVEPPALHFLPLAEPVDYDAVIMPYTLIEDLVAPVASPITDITKPVTKSDPLVIQIDDAIYLKGVVVIVKYPNGDWEGAYDGANFSARYKQAASGSSTIEKPLLSNRWILTLRREGGWPFDPTACIKAFDGAGNMS